MRRVIKYLVVLVCGILATSCDHKVTMGTIINEDGTCHREIVVELDKSATCVDRHNVGESMCVDSTWEACCVVQGEMESFSLPISAERYRELREKYPDKRFYVRYWRDFETVGEMCDAMPFVMGGRRVEVRGELTKRAKWLFFTEYTYREVYSSIESLFSLPLERYMTKEDAQIWTTGKVTRVTEDGREEVKEFFEGMGGYEVKDRLDEIEAKVNLWLSANVVYDLCELILSDYDNIEGTPISKEEFMRVRDEMVKGVRELKGSIEEFGEELERYVDSRVYVEYLGREDESREKGAGRRAISDKVFDKFFQVHDMMIDYNLKMPGELVSVGMGEERDGVAVYRVTGERLVPGTYEVLVSSQKINLVAVFGALIVLVVGSTIGIRFKRRR